MALPVATLTAAKRNKNLFDYFPEITATSYEDMLKETGLDIQVQKRKLYYADSKGVTRMNPEKCAIAVVDSGDFLGTVGLDYGLSQYDYVLKFLDILASEEGTEYKRGGIVGKGERAFVALTTGEHIRLPGGDEIESYFYVTTGHDGMQCIDVVPAPLRKLNNSVLVMPEVRGFKFRHTKHVNEHLSRAKMSIAKVKDYWSRFQKSFTYLAATRLTPQQLDDYLKMVVEGKNEESVRAENIRDEIRTIFQQDRHIAGLPSTAGTLLGAYFAVVQYCDFSSRVRKAKNDRRDEDTSRIISLIDGNAAQRKADGYAFAIQMLKKMGQVSLVGSGL